MARTVGRLAPSPSGEMHLGNAFSALLAWLSARAAGGALLLRLEDLDKPRCPERYGLGVMEDLVWLGLDWDNEPVWQSRREALYRRHLDTLAERGLVYPCYCTRRELHPRAEVSAPHAPGPLYPGTCRNLTEEQRARREAEGKAPALRVRVPEREYAFVDVCQGAYGAVLSKSCGDFILRRSDGLFAYQLAVVCDDAAMGVTQVVRGRDLLSSTPQQLWLQDQLGFPHPEYCHVPLLRAPDGRRLSKREGDLSLRALRKTRSPEELVGRLACWAGLLKTPRPVRPGELVADFSWEQVRKEDVTVEGF